MPLLLRQALRASSFSFPMTSRRPRLWRSSTAMVFRKRCSTCRRGIGPKAIAVWRLCRGARGVAANPWLIAVLVAFAAFMEVLDTTIANVALPYIAGGLGVSEDEASWVVTTYLVGNAVSLTGSSFFAQRFGRKPFFLICLALFTASSVPRGFAPNLQSLLLFRILQGLGGGGTARRGPRSAPTRCTT